MVKLGLPQSLRLVAEVLGTGSIPAELAAILVEHYQTVRKDGTARTLEERTGRALYPFLLHVALGEVPVPVLERVKLVGVDNNGRVHLMHLLLSVCVNVYSTECRIFACMGELPAKGLPQVTDLLPDIFAARCSIRSVPRIHHVAHLGGISPRDWQMKPCERAAKAAGTEHVNLDCRGLGFLPTNCAAWLLASSMNGPANVFEASPVLFRLLITNTEQIGRASCS